MLKIVADEAAREELTGSLDEIVLEGARRMLHAALEAEADAYLDAHRGERDEDATPWSSATEPLVRAR